MEEKKENETMRVSNLKIIIHAKVDSALVAAKIVQLLTKELNPHTNPTAEVNLRF